MPRGAVCQISGCVITYQEEDRIADCLGSMSSFCDELLVVDSGSTDRTCELAESKGARVIVHAPFPGHRQQKQHAVDQARHDWIFSLDADERASPELAARIGELKSSGLLHAAYQMPRKNQYLGKVLRYGLFHPDRKIRLFDRRRARWGGSNPHDRVVLDGGEEAALLEEPLTHLSFRDFAQHRRTVDSFTAIAARSLYEEKQRAGLFDLVVRPAAVVFKSLFLKLGFLDGWRGFLVAAMAGYYDWLKYWRLRRLWRNEPQARQSEQEQQG